MGKKQSLHDWCIENNKEHLIKEWNTQRNSEELGLDIQKVSFDSTKKAWWMSKDRNGDLISIKKRRLGFGFPSEISPRIFNIENK